MTRLPPRVDLMAVMAGLAVVVVSLWVISGTAVCVPYCVPQSGPYFGAATAAYLAGSVLIVGGLVASGFRSPRTSGRFAQWLLAAASVPILAGAYLYTIVTNL